MVCYAIVDALSSTHIVSKTDLDCIVDAENSLNVKSSEEVTAVLSDPTHCCSEEPVSL